MWTLPNLLSLFRIAIIPLLVYLLTFTDPVSALWAAFLFLLASLTDFFDGYLARRNQSVSNLGKILDPLADKLMILSALVMLAAMDRMDEPEVPAWLVAAVVARETAVTILRGIALTEGIVMEAEELGKYKFVLQSFAVFGLLVHYPHLGIDFYAIGMYFLVVSAVIAIWSGVNYHLRFFQLWRQKGPAARLSRN
ncbi:MAG: CDP-diacylglycerol--glycerol-3-phosphate 3-phosphatidyltransferase [Deltaproteobacteria bacterium RIFCSPLOWO2_12_FULL_60_19]|nr:MAG: CDP-diacylglycerol--glycerol-3-phosphate 3-phosphatidyltransferase [Deltaproteobacteria bacterium RIFCSPLOWO2_12_FULL_60_19]